MNILCVLLLLASFTDAKVTSAQLIEERNKYKKVLADFPCKFPQRRSFSVKSFLYNDLSPAELVIPHTVVLHRCDEGSGCCDNSEHVCKVANLTDVQINVIVMNTFKKQNFDIRTFSVTNHTECKCQSRNNVIK